MSTALEQDRDRVDAPATAPNSTIFRWLTPASVLLSALLLAVIAAVGGWMRRWMSDDGLIVLRTVRNLLAGNGPVFNAGERVEANTSTLWQYLIYVGALISDARLETIAMWLALGLTTLALLIAGLATAALYRGRAGLLFLPVGGLIYLALPAARDFATAGLEWGLSLFWLSVQWLLLVNWTRSHSRSPGRHARGADQADWVLYLLAFWSGLSWLVRPELALYGGLTGILLLVTARNVPTGLRILAAALPVPAAYQIFRMGYYGLITPHTAVAKSASDSEWAEGWNYVLDFAGPYGLFFILALAAVIAAALLWRVSGSAGSAGSLGAVGSTVSIADDAALPRRFWLRSRAGVVGLMLFAGSAHLIYVIRVGGDFMHGRMLLLPLFALLLPVAIVPIVDLVARNIKADAVLVAAGLVAVVWAWVIMDRGTDHIDWAEYEVGELGIVDEREFWTNATQRDRGHPPRFAEDFLPSKALGDWEPSVHDAMDEDAAQMLQVILSEDPERYAWINAERMDGDSDLNDLNTTVYLINLGMTSMNTPLDMRVLDTVGLSTPLAARQPRDPEGRVGHDKWLPLNWQAADTDMDLGEAPPWLDREVSMMVRAALRTPQLAELLASYREPMSASRFIENIGFSLGPGRTLEISDDPRDYLDEQTIAEIEAIAEASETDSQIAETAPGNTGERIVWPVEVKTDERW